MLQRIVLVIIIVITTNGRLLITLVYLVQVDERWFILVFLVVGGYIVRAVPFLVFVINADLWRVIDVVIFCMNISVIFSTCRVFFIQLLRLFPFLYTFGVPAFKWQARNWLDLMPIIAILLLIGISPVVNLIFYLCSLGLTKIEAIYFEQFVQLFENGLYCLWVIHINYFLFLEKAEYPDNILVQQLSSQLSLILIFPLLFDIQLLLRIRALLLWWLHLWWRWAVVKYGKDLSYANEFSRRRHCNIPEGVEYFWIEELIQYLLVLLILTQETIIKVTIFGRVYANKMATSLIFENCLNYHFSVLRTKLQKIIEILLLNPCQTFHVFYLVV